MPFKSKAQQRYMFAAEERGELPAGTAQRWADHTPNIKKLPERTKTAGAIINFIIRKLLRKEEAQAKPDHHERGSEMKKLGEEVYQLAVNHYFTKRANQAGYQMYAQEPQPQETSAYQKFLNVKRRNDPYFSIGAGGALGALAGSTKGKLMAGVGGGLGAIAGHHLARKD